MDIMALVVIGCMALKEVQLLRVQPKNRLKDTDLLQRIYKILSNTQYYLVDREPRIQRRSKGYDANIDSEEAYKNILRHEPQGMTHEREIETVHSELKALHTRQGPGSALLETPYVEHRGRSDYLIMGADHDDPLMWVVPNDIYYGTEKKCVNWLDKCNVHGIRNNLLMRIEDP